MKDKLVLKNGNEIELETSATLDNLNIIFNDKTSMIETWDLMTNDNLSSVSIKNSDGLVVANYGHLVFVSETSVITYGGKISTSFKLREKSDLELRLEKIETTQEIQDGAISDLGEAVSVLSEM